MDALDEGESVVHSSDDEDGKDASAGVKAEKKQSK